MTVTLAWNAKCGSFPLTRSVSCMNDQWVDRAEQFPLFCWYEVNEDVSLLWDWSFAVRLQNRNPTHFGSVQSSRMQLSKCDFKSEIGMHSSEMSSWRAALTAETANASVARDNLLSILYPFRMHFDHKMKGIVHAEYSLKRLPGIKENQKRLFFLWMVDVWKS